MFDFSAHPGLLYVYATLLPLLSFLLLFLAGGIRGLARSYKGSGLGRTIYDLLGGDTPRRTGAYVATAAIALSFVLSLVGFLLHAQDVAHHDTHEHHAAAGHHDPHDHDHDKKTSHHDESRWTDDWTWAEIYVPGRPDAPATKLTLGYYIDSLTATMFLMITLIATMIHLFSIGYMSEELQQTVEDHQVHTEDGHLHRKGRFGRFFMFLSLFCFSMLNLVLADNLFQVFVSWELVGICSFLLIGFYYERSSASNAANKAFITNRIGDAGFIIGLLILWTYVGTFNFQEIFQHVRGPYNSHGGADELTAHIVRGDPAPAKDGVPQLRLDPHGGEVVLFQKMPKVDHYHLPHEGEVIPVNASAQFHEEHPSYFQTSTMPYWLLVAAGLGIFLGCVGKSAQFPLHVWLPDAMEGPTPVSALIHAATMVAAGVYLVGRVFPLFAPEALLVIAYIGGITLFVAATIAIVMTDIKKVLAYSTVSQLGYMMLALGIGGWAAGMFHLITHAFFKALLFLGSGSVIYGCHHEQEMPKMGGLYPKMKITAITMLIGVLAIAGTPFLSGWYSKDAIIAQAVGYVMVNPQHLLLLLLPLITAGITTFYMFRMWFLTFTGTPRDHQVHEHAHESPYVMTVPLMVLAFFTVTVGWGWPLWDAEASHLEHHIHHSQHVAVATGFGAIEGEEFLGAGLERERHLAQQYHLLAGGLALFVAVLGAVFAALVYYFHKLDPAEAKEQFPGLHRLLWNKWYFDELYSAILVRPVLVVAAWCRNFDLKVIDGLIDGSGRWTIKIADWNGLFDNGVIDGLVNLTSRVIYAAGAWLRNVQTGYIRSYILFLVLAAIGVFALLTYFVTQVTAG
ncbi:MAG: NADH-quinone oxidoreductase subunit L [Gemmataceae bacterium]